VAPRRTALVSLIVLAGPQLMCAQQSTTARGGGSHPPPPPASQQITAAVLPLPEQFRASATVLGYGAKGSLQELRKGTGPFICLASDPAGERFHVACYHRSLEPFMARGRELRAQGVKGQQVDSVRFAEARAGRLQMPNQPAALYSLTGPAGSFDPKSGTAPKARPLFVVYVPNATPETTGLSPQPVEGSPWIMDPGTPKAHIMFVPKM
jgi:hypothetical protein